MLSKIRIQSNDINRISSTDICYYNPLGAKGIFIYNQERIQEFRKGGSKIKFMKGEGKGGGVFHLFSMKIKALS